MGLQTSISWPKASLWGLFVARFPNPLVFRIEVGEPDWCFGTFDESLVEAGAQGVMFMVNVVVIVIYLLSIAAKSR